MAHWSSYVQAVEALGVKGIMVLNAREGGPAWKAGIVVSHECSSPESWPLPPDHVGSLGSAVLSSHDLLCTLVCKMVA
jgi:hypothetical protein